jgi:NAD(P)-dependent dehydrogenase (short-subunit alcohol dehydrogenase family)
MAQYEFRERRIWITGASSGIGRALALELALRGARVALSARSRPGLETLSMEIGKDRTLVLPFDATQRAGSQAAVQAMRGAWGGLDMAIFNAGDCEYIDVAAFDAEVFRRQFEINVMAMVHGIEAALPLLRESPHPYLVGMSSLSALKGLPRAEAYGASKAAARCLLESLRLDLRPLGIPVTSILPGFVRTPLTGRNDFPMPFLMEADAAARRIADGLARRSHEIAFPWQMSGALRLAAFLPSAWVTPLLARLVRPV